MKNLINREATSHGSTLMQMNVECVMDCLNSEGIVYTVRGYKMSNGKVSINGSLLCDRVSVKKVASKDDLINFVKFSGFKSVDDWWDKIRMFVKDDREMWLYKVTASASTDQSTNLSTMVGIVGSRSRDDPKSIIDLIYSLPDNSTIISGGCKGPDKWAAQAARKRGLKVIEFFPDLADQLTYLEATQRYYDRNQKIAETCDVLHAFVSDKRIGGTENTIQHAERLHKQVVIHLPEIDKEKQQETKHNLFSSNNQTKPKMVTTPHPAVRRTDNLNSPEFISELKENDVFVFGSNLGGFHGAGSAGYAMRGTTSNTWRSDKTFLSALNGSDKRGTWAVLGKGIGFQTGKSGSSYAVPTVERPGVKGRVDLEFFRKQLITFCTFAGAHPELRFLVVKLGATRDEGGFSYLGSGNVKSCWESIHKLTGIPDNILLPKEHNPRQDKEKQQETKHNLFSSNKQIKPKMVAKTNVETNHTDINETTEHNGFSIGEAVRTNYSNTPGVILRFNHALGKPAAWIEFKPRWPNQAGVAPDLETEMCYALKDIHKDNNTDNNKQTHAAVQTIVELFKEPELGTTTPKQNPKAKPTPLEDIKSILAKHGSFHKRPIRMQRTAPNTYSVISGHLTLRSCLSGEEASLYIHHLTTPTPRTNAELETIEEAIYNNPNKPRRHKPAKQFVPNKQALCLLPGVRNAWTHRGKLCIAILNDYKQDFLNTMSIDFEQTSRMGPTSVLKSKETICPVASMKQRFAADAKEARLDDTHLGVFRNTRYSRILDLLEAYGSDSLPEGMVHIDERYELEDELDVVPNSLIVEEGMQGFHYKEDYDLERAQKTEHQIQMRANIINYKEFLRDTQIESQNPLLVV